jgi:hypothetical protein
MISVPTHAGYLYFTVCDTAGKLACGVSGGERIRALIPKYNCVDLATLVDCGYGTSGEDENGCYR